MMQDDIREIVKNLLENQKINRAVQLLCERYNIVYSNVQKEYLTSLNTLANDIININNEFLIKEEQLKKENVTLELYNLSNYAVTWEKKGIKVFEDIAELNNIIHIPRFNDLILNDKDIADLEKTILAFNALVCPYDIAPIEVEYQEWLKKYGKLLEFNNDVEKILYYKIIVKKNKISFRETEEEIEKIINEGNALKQKKDILSSLTIEQMASIVEYYNLFKKYESYFGTIQKELYNISVTYNCAHSYTFRDTYKSWLGNYEFKRGLRELKDNTNNYFVKYNRNNENQFKEFDSIHFWIQEEEFLFRLMELLYFDKCHFHGARTTPLLTLEQLKPIIEKNKKTTEINKVKLKI